MSDLVQTRYITNKFITMPCLKVLRSCSYAPLEALSLKNGNLLSTPRLSQKKGGTLRNKYLFFPPAPWNCLCIHNTITDTTKSNSMLTYLCQQNLSNWQPNCFRQPYCFKPVIVKLVMDHQHNRNPGIPHFALHGEGGRRKY